MPATASWSEVPQGVGEGSGILPEGYDGLFWTKVKSTPKLYSAGLQPYLHTVTDKLGTGRRIWCQSGVSLAMVFSIELGGRNIVLHLPVRAKICVGRRKLRIMVARQAMAVGPLKRSWRCRASDSMPEWGISRHDHRYLNEGAERGVFTRLCAQKSALEGGKYASWQHAKQWQWAL